MTPQGVKRIFRARYLLPISGPPVETGAVMVCSGRIVAVGPADDLLRSTTGAELVDCGDTVLMPALVNAHTHLELTDFPAWAAEAGEAEPSAEEDFVDWVLRLIRVKRARPAEDFFPAIERGLKLLLKSGTGAMGDILSFHAAISAYRETPLAGEVFFETLGRDPQVTRPLLSNLSKQLDHVPARHLVPAVSPHATYTVSADYLQRVFDFSAKRPCLASIHLAESQAEVELVRDGAGDFVDRLFPLAGWQDLAPQASGLSPVAWLEEQGGLRPDVLLVHGVQVDGEDLARMKKCGSGVVLCPRSNALLGVGRAPVELYRQAGIPLALGTDSLASNTSLSLWDELAAAARIYSGVFSPDELLHIATLGGAGLLGLDRLFGSLETGKGANFQLVDLPAGADQNSLAEALVCDGQQRTVHQLYLHGEKQL